MSVSLTFISPPKKDLSFTSNSNWSYSLTGSNITTLLKEMKTTLTIPASILSTASGITITGSLTSLICSDMNIGTIKFTDLSALTYLDCSNNLLTTLEVASLPGLTYLDCGANSNINGDLPKHQNQISKLEVATLSSLTYLACGGNNIHDLNVTHLTELTHLDCNSNALDTLNVVNLTNLTHLDCICRI